MKDNLTNDADTVNKNSGEQQANFAKNGGLLQNGHSAFERRHHSADSFQHQQHHQGKLANSQKTADLKATSTLVQQQQDNRGRQQISNSSRAKKAAIDYDSIDQSAQALLLLSSEKENDKLNGLLFSHQDKQQQQRQGQDAEEDAEDEECDSKSEGPRDFVKQNGIHCDVDDEEDANEHLMNESEHDLSEVSAVGGNYMIHEDEDGDEHHLSKLNI